MSRKKTIVEIPIERVEFPRKSFSTFGEKEVRLKGGILGEKVQVLINRRRKNYCQGRILKTIENSPLETEEGCEAFGECGGCSYQKMKYETELAYKKEMLINLFNDKGIEIEDLILHPSPKELNYRNKMEYTCGNSEKDGPLVIGLHKRGVFHDIVDTKGCNIVHPDMEKIRIAVQEFYREKEVDFYHRRSHKGILRHLVIRISETKPMILVQIVTSSQGEAYIKELKDHLLNLDLEKEITGIVHTINDNIADTVQSDISQIIYGQDFIEEEIDNLNFSISPESFFQTNTIGAEFLYEKALSFVENLKGKRVLDLYSGTGTIGQIVAKHAKEVISIEIVPEAVENAKISAKENKIKNIQFICGDVLEKIDEIEGEKDLIIIDPPRPGIHPKAVSKIASSNAKEILYISCNPVTLIENLHSFKTAGYKIKRLEAVDMFPRTPHVEVVTLLVKE